MLRSPNYAAIAAGVLAIILYGSFFPFGYEPRSNSAGPFAALLETWSRWPGQGHFITNILLYLPLGLFAALALTRGSLVSRVLRVSGAGVMLSLSVELAQYYARARDSELSDVCANALGTLAGALAGVFLANRSARASSPERKPRLFVMMVLGCWLACQLLITRGSFDLNSESQAPSLYSVYQFAAIWIAIGLLCEAAFGKSWVWLAPAVLFGIVLAGRSFGVRHPSAEEVWGGAAGLLVWSALVSRLRARGVVVAALFIAAVVIEALDPFMFRATGRTLGLIPFQGFIEAPPHTGVPKFLEKVFRYGTLVWLIGRAGVTTQMTAIFAGLLVLGLRCLQVYVPGRSADVTDVLMLLMLAALMYLMVEEPQHLSGGPGAP